MVAVGQHEIAGIADGKRWMALARFQTGQCHERFEGRARWIDTLECAVNQWLVQRVIEAVPVVKVNAIDKQIGIK